MVAYGSGGRGNDYTGSSGSSSWNCPAVFYFPTTVVTNVSVLSSGYFAFLARVGVNFVAGQLKQPSTLRDDI